MEITSDAFAHNDPIPAKYTCDGDDLSPRLSWSGVPEGARSLVLIVDDPDAPDPAAPKMTWVHWVLYNIPVDCPGLPPGVHTLPGGILEGTNNWNRTRYGGPCPPVGRHRYFHKLYALDTIFTDLKEPTAAQLEEAMANHILEKAELIGTYERA